MRRTRRAVLAGVGVGIAGLAGCSSGGGATTATGDCTVEEEPTVSELPPPVAGDPEADVTVMVFEDFACPHCRDFHLNELPAIREELLDPGEVRYEHHDLPIPVSDRWSWWVASAARGVQDALGDAAFFEFAARAFENQSEFSMATVAETAEAVGADPCAAQTDAANETYRPVLEADRALAQNLGASGTPAVYVDGEEAEATADGIRLAVDQAR